MIDIESLMLHPLPPAADFMFSAFAFKSVYIYRFHEDRWHLQADGEEYMLIDCAEGLKLIDNPF